MKKSSGRKSSGRSSDSSKSSLGRKSGTRKSFGSDRLSRDSRPRRYNDDDSRKTYSGDRPKKRFDDDRPRRKFDGDDRLPRRSRDDDSRKTYSGDRPKKRFDGDRPTRRSDDDSRKTYSGDRPKKRFDGDRPPRQKFEGDERPPRRKFNGDDRQPRRRFDGDERTLRRSSDDNPRRRFGEKPPRKNFGIDKREDEWQIFENAEEAGAFKEKSSSRNFRKPKGAPSRYAEPIDGQLRLNRFIANTGLCSRREADELIEAGVIKVNGKIVTELGTKIGPSDTVHYGDQLLRRERLQYILLNKPKDFITTTDDPQDRKTVLQLVADACDERIYPVGRLDRNTTGLLLLTNDGDLADRLMHPRFGVHKIYHVMLDKALRPEDFEAIETGVELEDGPIKADELSYVGEGGNRKEVGIVLHSGRNRIVRRIFEHLGYVVTGLDRVVYAGLTKKNLSRGRWRHLTEEEVGMLKMTHGGAAKKNSRKSFGYRKKQREKKG
jgi:23S rRNA pseudouridine2605 synthase